MISPKLGFNNSFRPNYCKSEGIQLFDSDNTCYLDLFSNFSSLPFGHNYAPLAEYLASIDLNLTERVPLCAFNQVEVDQFCEKFNNFLPESFNFISFAENGGLAIEQVVKSYLYFAYTLGKSCRFYVFEGSYHGIIGLSAFLTMIAGSANDRLSFLTNDLLDVFKIYSLEELPDDHTNFVNILFVEPIRCTAGDLLPSSNMLKLISAFQELDNCYLVYDEIQSGFYATFVDWGYKYLDLPPPDVLVFGKRLQICGFVSNSVIEVVFSKSSPKILSSTFDGSLLDVIRGIFMLEHTPSYLEGCKTDLYLLIKDLLYNLENWLSAIRSDSHGCLASLEFKSPTDMEFASSLLEKKHILHNSTKPNKIRLRFPFNFSPNDLDQITSRIF